MTESWNLKSIDEIAEIGRGRSRHRPRNASELYGGVYPFVQTAEIHASDLYINTFSKTYNEAGLAQSKLWDSGVICITNAGENTGDCAILGIQACVPDSVITVIPDPEETDPVFLKYAIDQLKSQLRAVTKGATQDNLSIAKLTAFKFQVPSVATQRQIGHILRCYGDLIENNRRRIQLLERSLHLLYKEWFVHLRFPSHEHSKIVDGIPEGWGKFQLADLCKIGRGASPRPINNFMDGEVPWFKIGDATASESPFVFETKEKVTEDGARKSVIIEPESLILSNSATCGIPYFSGITGCIHDGWLHFAEYKKISKFFLYLFLVSKQRELLQMVCDGSTQKNLNTTVVSRLVLTLPLDGQLLELFNESIEPLFLQMLALTKYNIALRKARDLLLPKLMSGAISV